MATYRFKAVDASGEILEGEMQGHGEEAVIRHLQALGHVPILVDEVTDIASGQGVSTAWSRLARLDRARFTRDLANLLRAGIALDRALEMLTEIADDARTRHLLGDLLEHVRSGAALSAALALHEREFGAFYISMIKAAEAGGNMADALERLGDYLERLDTLKRNLQTALIYPGILIVVTALSLLVLVTFVLPQFATLFNEMGAALPLPSRMVMALGEFLHDYASGLLILLILLVLGIRQSLKQPAIRHKADARVLQIPLLGDLVAKFETAIFARSLGTLLAGGVPMLAALSMVKEHLHNRVLQEGVATLAESVQQGKGLAEPLSRNGHFPKLAMHLLRVGEETGQLEDMLQQIAAIYDSEVNRSMQRMLALLEPLLIVGLGGVIGAIILSILLAVLKVNELAF